MPSTLMQRMTALDAKVLRRSPGDIYVAPPAWTPSDGPVRAEAMTQSEVTALTALAIALMAIGAADLAAGGEGENSFWSDVGTAAALGFALLVTRPRGGRHRAQIVLRLLPAHTPLVARSPWLLIGSAAAAAVMVIAALATRDPLELLVFATYALYLGRRSQQRLLRIQHSQGGIIVKLAIRGRRKRGTSELYLLRKPTTHIEDLGPLTNGNA